mgnify:CR=1 FL=1
MRRSRDPAAGIRLTISMKRVQKGQFGYVACQKKLSMLITIISFGICLGIFTAGLIITGDRKNVFTIVAVLGCLPAAKAMVNAIMFMRAGGCSESAHESIEKAMDQGMTGLYDLYMTSYQENYAISHLVVTGNSVTGLTEDPGCDLSAAEKHVAEHLGVDGFKDVTVKIHTNVDAYAQRLVRIAKLSDEHASRIPAMAETLKAISL